MEASRLARMLNEARSVAKKRTQSYSGSEFVCSDPSKAELPEVVRHLRTARMAESAIHAARTARIAPPIRAKQCYQKWYILWACALPPTPRKSFSDQFRLHAPPCQLNFVDIFCLHWQTHVANKVSLNNHFLTLNFEIVFDRPLKNVSATDISEPPD